MTSRAKLDDVTIDEGVSVELEPDHPPGIGVVELDENGDIIMTPEFEAELAEAEAEGDRGEGIPLEEFLAELARMRTRPR